MSEDLATSDSQEAYLGDYRRFRGRCKELAEQAVQADPSLRLVRGHYFCPIWNREEPHWWCEDALGKVVDPSSRQFPSQGLGIYTEFSGWVVCVECGKEMPEEDAQQAGNYAICSARCYGSLVGVPVG